MVSCTCHTSTLDLPYLPAGNHYDTPAFRHPSTSALQSPSALAIFTSDPDTLWWITSSTDFATPPAAAEIPSIHRSIVALLGSSSMASDPAGAPQKYPSHFLSQSNPPADIIAHIAQLFRRTRSVKTTFALGLWWRSGAQSASSESMPPIQLWRNPGTAFSPLDHAGQQDIAIKADAPELPSEIICLLGRAQIRSDRHLKTSAVQLPHRRT